MTNKNRAGKQQTTGFLRLRGGRAVSGGGRGSVSPPLFLCWHSGVPHHHYYLLAAAFWHIHPPLPHPTCLLYHPASTTPTFPSLPLLHLHLPASISFLPCLFMPCVGLVGWFLVGGSNGILNNTLDSHNFCCALYAQPYLHVFFCLMPCWLCCMPAPSPRLPCPSLAAPFPCAHMHTYMPCAFSLPTVTYTLLHFCGLEHGMQHAHAWQPAP